MTLIVCLGTAFLFGTGFFLLLKRGLLNRAFGILLISHGANHILILMGGLSPHPRPPLLHEAVKTFADPLPQALILTALVIGFSLAAFLWAMVLRLGREEPQ